MKVHDGVRIWIGHRNRKGILGAHREGRVVGAREGRRVRADVEAWQASGETPLFAQTSKGKASEVTVPLVSPNLAVPSPLSAKVTPDGRDPWTLRVGVGEPVEVMVKGVAGLLNTTEAAEVIVGVLGTNMPILTRRPWWPCLSQHRNQKRPLTSRNCKRLPGFRPPPRVPP